MFQALGVPDRYPAVPSVSCSSVRQCIRAPLVALLGYASAAWLSPTRYAFAVEELIPFMDSSTSCGVCAFLASSVSHGVATPPLLPTLTVYYREVPLLGFRLVWC